MRINPIKKYFKGKYKKCACGCGTLVKILGAQQKFKNYELRHGQKNIDYSGRMCYICGSTETKKTINKKTGAIHVEWHKDAHLYKCMRCFIRDYGRDWYNTVKNNR